MKFIQYSCFLILLARVVLPYCNRNMVHFLTRHTTCWKKKGGKRRWIFVCCSTRLHQANDRWQNDFAKGRSTTSCHVEDQPEQRENGAKLIRFSDQPLSLSHSPLFVLNSNPIHDSHLTSPLMVFLSASSLSLFSFALPFLLSVIRLMKSCWTTDENLPSFSIFFLPTRCMTS